MQQHSLVLYKNRPACVKRSGEKLEIELEDGKRAKVRPKDVRLLHPGPLQSLQDLTSQGGDVETAWELLAGETTTLEELAELIYDAYTPATAWAAWQQVAEGIYFQGTPEVVTVRTAEELAQARAGRAAKAAEKGAWAAFLKHARNNQTRPEDSRYLGEVARFALRQSTRSRALRELEQTETPENAHALLLKLGHWDHTQNPYPKRLGLPTDPPTAPLPSLPQEERVDLTHLAVFAIDDEGSQDPDDALSLEAGRLWVHIADVAALVHPDTPADREACARGANLYLPEGTVSMLPPEATRRLGLGLGEVSPALSFGLDLVSDGTVTKMDIVPSWVRVQRFTYDEVETRLGEAPFRGLHQLAQTALARRDAQGAIAIDLPEVKIGVKDGQVHIRPLPTLKSRDLVREAMLLCGEALARFARQEGIPFPYTVQAPPEEHEPYPGLAGMFARRRTMKPSQRQIEPGHHAGLGLDIYTQATSPLRRYADLVAHQQLRAYLRGGPLLTAQEIITRLGQAEAASSSVRQAERLSYKHWTLVYLQQNRGWQGEGVLVERRGPRALVLIPELDLEVWMPLPDTLSLNGTVSLGGCRVNLPLLDAHFQVGK